MTKPEFPDEDSEIRKALIALVGDLRATYTVAGRNKPIVISIGQWSRLARAERLIKQMQAKPSLEQRINAKMADLGAELAKLPGLGSVGGIPRETLITWDNTAGQPIHSTWGSFVDANSDDPGIIADALDGLTRTGEATLGGGAQPVYVVRFVHAATAGA